MTGLKGMQDLIGLKGMAGLLQMKRGLATVWASCRPDARWIRALHGLLLYS